VRALRRTLPTATALGALLLCAGGCAAFVDGPRRTTQRCELPADVATALLSAALREELRAEPIAAQAGAPAQRSDDGAYLVEFTGDDRGRWLPRADRRLSLRWHADTRSARVHERRLGDRERLAGFGRRTAHTLRITIEPDGARCRVHVDVPEALAERVLPVLSRTLDLACGPELTAPGLSEPNLATWRAAQLVRAGGDARRERPERTGELMWRAVRLTGIGGVVHEQLAELATTHGDERRALLQFRRALLLTPDPCQRAGLARRAAAAELRLQQPTRLRNEAVEHLQNGELAAAETLLHSARRRTPAPIVDYYLLSRVHRLRGDELGELAARLLSREHEPATADATATADRAWREHMREWSRRLTLGLSPMVPNARPPR